MQNRKALIRWGIITVSIFIVTLVAWNTSVFFDVLKQNERSKMQIWASAQQDLQEQILSNDGVMSDVVLKVIEGNTTTPMVMHQMENDTYDYRNLDLPKLDSIKLQKRLVKLSKQFA
ncbi:MAG: hypothetical protein CMC15_08850, partial [Flavobacteriaceae bacterium]|nr:hypothetical protein [Flavobacteriaceae bacterium]